MLTTHRNLSWKAPSSPASVTPQQLQRVAEARGFRLIDLVAAIVGDAARTAAWEAFANDVPMTWLPLDHFQHGSRR